MTWSVGRYAGLDEPDGSYWPRSALLVLRDSAYGCWSVAIGVTDDGRMSSMQIDVNHTHVGWVMDFARPHLGTMSVAGIAMDTPVSRETFAAWTHAFLVKSRLPTTFGLGVNGNDRPLDAAGRRA
jgi:hypothetical protein